MATKHRYVPILRWKEGEQAALKNLSSGSKAGVTPLIILLRGQYASTKPPPKKAPKKPRPPAGPAAEMFCMSVADAWGGSEMYLDASDLPFHDDKQHLLDEIASAARAAGLRIVPATTMDAPEPYQAAVRRMASTDGRGAALRVSLGEITSASAWLGSWFCPLDETDLIIDLGREAPTIAAVRVAVAPMFVELHRAGDWRTVTVAGSCMPQNFSGLAVGTHRFARSELSVWHALAAHGLPYPIDFGDYATVAVGAAPPGVRWGFPITPSTLSRTMCSCATACAPPVMGPSGWDRSLSGTPKQSLPCATEAPCAIAGATHKLTRSPRARPSPEG